MVVYSSKGAGLLHGAVLRAHAFVRIVTAHAFVIKEVVEGDDVCGISCVLKTYSIVTWLGKSRVFCLLERVHEIEPRTSRTRSLFQGGSVH